MAPEALRPANILRVGGYTNLEDEWVPVEYIIVPVDPTREIIRNQQSFQDARDTARSEGFFVKEVVR